MTVLRDLGNSDDAQYTYTIGSGTANNYADNTQWIVNNDGNWKPADAATVTWTIPNDERIKVIEEALVVLADMMMVSGIPDALKTNFLDIVNGLREEEVKEEFEDHIDPELFEIKDDF